MVPNMSLTKTKVTHDIGDTISYQKQKNDNDLFFSGFYLGFINIKLNEVMEKYSSNKYGRY